MVNVQRYLSSLDAMIDRLSDTTADYIEDVKGLENRIAAFGMGFFAANAVADHAMTYLYCKSPGWEASPFIQNMMLRFGTNEGLLVSAAAEATVVAGVYGLYKCAERYISIRKPRERFLPKIAFYSGLCSAGLAHFNAATLWFERAFG